MRTYALIGDPVGQSVSPAMQQAAFDAAGVDARYVAVVVTPTGLPKQFPRLRHQMAGLNVTRPLKEAVIPLLDSISHEARRAGSVNTVLFRDGRAEGHSTDGHGFMAALAHASAILPRRAVVLGTGGSARAVAAALLDAGCRVTMLGRSPVAGRRTAEDLGGRVRFESMDRAHDVISMADLLVNATPVGAQPGASPTPDGVHLDAHPVVFDLVYRPRETSLIRQARAAGCRVVHGIEMLIEQGARSFELWTGVTAPLRVMRTAAYQALAREPALGRTG